MINRLIFSDFIDLSDFDFEESPQVERRGPGRPPLKVTNPLDQIPKEVYLTDRGRPKAWLEDCLTGVIRSLGNKDSRLVDTGRYVSLWKVLQALILLKGDLTPKRVAEALRMSANASWRVVKAIELAGPFIFRFKAKTSL
jgi:hypothetical protein